MVDPISQLHEVLAQLVALPQVPGKLLDQFEEALKALDPRPEAFEE